MAQNNSGAGRHDADQIKADKAAIDKGICPETGIDLSTVNVAAHIAHYFPDYANADPKSDNARRKRLLQEYADKQAAKSKPAKGDD